MRYNKQQLARYFLDWPSLRETTNLDMVIARVDMLQAVSRLEGIPIEQATLAMDQVWDRLRRMSTLAFVAGAVAFAEQVLPVINKGA